jgi:4-oxalmesaconate hydratase
MRRWGSFCSEEQALTKPLKFLSSTERDGTLGSTIGMVTVRFVRSTSSSKRLLLCHTPNFHTTGAHYINADTTAFMQFIEGDLFRDFPTLRFIIPHGGGAVPYHWGRYRGLADMLKRPPLPEHVMKNVYFDTCVYHQAGIDLLVKVIDIRNILFGSEMVGAVRGIDPGTGHYFDDTKRYIDALDISPDAKRQIFETNARRVFPRLDTRLRARGL